MNPRTVSQFYLLWLFAAGSAVAAGDVLTQGYDRSRTGAQLEEKILNVRNVRPETFGKVASLTVDGYVHTQPLAVNALQTANATIDVL
jgi:hypothetical protein